MKISDHPITKTCLESEIIKNVINLDHKKILELGCGAAIITRLFAQEGLNRTITATEVDEIQHEKNLQIKDLPNVDFVFAGSQDLPFDKNSFDVILLFKSLHHVPMQLMSKAMSEIARVLKPGGLVYISEPIFAGDFNEILRLFHDEEKARIAAFNAIVKSVESNELISIDQMFFNTSRTYQDFSEFEKLIINVTHSYHQLSDTLMQKVKTKFMAHMTKDGATFNTPIRVDLLSKK